MKLTDLFSRAKRRPHHAVKIETAARLAAGFDSNVGREVTDRSSMAELVRLLKEAEDAQTTSGRQPL
jgi:hypothetical protein